MRKRGDGYLRSHATCKYTGLLLRSAIRYGDGSAEAWETPEAGLVSASDRADDRREIEIVA